MGEGRSCRTHVPVASRLGLSEVGERSKGSRFPWPGAPTRAASGGPVAGGRGDAVAPLPPHGEVGSSASSPLLHGGADGPRIENAMHQRSEGERGPEPSSVWFDRYNLLQMAEELRLTHQESWLLTVLCLLVPWRRRSYLGPFGDLANEARMDPKVAKKAMAGLEARGLVRIVTPFTRHGGEVQVLAYSHVVRIDRKYLTPSEAAWTPLKSLSNPVEPQSGDERDSADAADQQERVETAPSFPETLRTQVAKEEGSTRASRRQLSCSLNEVGPDGRVKRP